MNAVNEYSVVVVVVVAVYGVIFVEEGGVENEEGSG